MGWEEILKRKEELLEGFLKLIEGKEAKAKLDLNGLNFKIGSSKIELGGHVEFTFIPVEKVKKK